MEPGINADPEKKSRRTRKDDVAHFFILKTGQTIFEYMWFFLIITFGPLENIVFGS
jgi:hypothetical protein